VGQDSAEYSVHNTSQQALFLRASRAAKYKGKAAIDTLFVRLGDLSATLWIFIAAQLDVSTRVYAFANVVAALVWLALALQLRKHTRQTGAAVVAPAEAVHAAAAASARSLG
jgi:ATP/ADP translocase